MERVPPALDAHPPVPLQPAAPGLPPAGGRHLRQAEKAAGAGEGGAGWLLRPLQPSSSPGIPEVQAEGVREHLGHPSGGPTGRVIPQAPAALLEVGTGLPAVPGRDGDLAAAVLAADPARGAAAAPGPPGSHHAAHRCRAWRRSRGEGKEGKKSLNSIKDKGEKLCRGGEPGPPPRGSSPSPAALCAASGGFYSHAAASS